MRRRASSASSAAPPGSGGSPCSSRSASLARGRGAAASAHRARGRRAARRRAPAVELRGFECFEGIAPGEDLASPRRRRAELARGPLRRRGQARDEGLLAPGVEPWITAGGSAFFDLVASGLSAPRRLPPRPAERLLPRARRRAVRRARRRRPRRGWGARCDDRPVLRPALELWAEVLSRPEPGLAILNAGKRDVPQDAGLAVPRRHLRAGDAAPRAGLGLAARRDLRPARPALDAAGEEPAIGDRVGLGVSHPCTTFDRWQVRVRGRGGRRGAGRDPHVLLRRLDARAQSGILAPRRRFRLIGAGVT